MSHFGKTLFNGSRFIFWALGPVLTLFAIVLPLYIPKWSIETAIVVIGVDAGVILLVVGLYNTKKFWWALRGVTAIVFFAYLAYLLDEFIRGHFTLAGLFTGDLPVEVLKTFIQIGIPCLLYALIGKFSRTKSEGRVEQIVGRRDSVKLLAERPEVADG
jgi:hypothetical protein